MTQGEASYALGLLMFFVGNRGAAVEHLTSAFEIYTHRLVRSAAGGTVLPEAVLYSALYFNFNVLVIISKIGT